MTRPTTSPHLALVPTDGGQPASDPMRALVERAGMSGDVYDSMRRHPTNWDRDVDAIVARFERADAAWEEGIGK